MAIDVRAIANGERVNFSERLELSPPKAYGVLERLVPADVSGSVIRHGDAFTVMAECRAALSVECARCLAAVPLAFDFALEETFAENPGEDRDDADVWPIHDKRVDLTAAVESCLYSLIPSRALCGRESEEDLELGGNGNGRNMS